MECVLSGNGLKSLHRAVNCLARIGTELLLEALPDKVILRTLNSSRSAFLAVIFKAQFFDRFQLSVPAAQCSVLLKAVCTVFRTPPSSMERLMITLPNKDATKLQWAIECLNGLRKTYWISCNYDVEMQHVAVDRSMLPSHLVVKPRDLNRLLANFQANLQEITLIATEPFMTPTDSNSTPEAKAIELRSYIDPVKESADGALHTQLWIDPAEELQEYSHSGMAVDVTFGVKELKAFMAFCEGSEADLHFYFEKAGNPILLAPRFGLDDSAHTDFDATLVLATMLGTQLGNSQNSDVVVDGLVAPQTAAQNVDRVSQEHSRLRTPGQVNGATESGQPSDHTVTWSELSGSAEKTSVSGRMPGKEPIQLQDSGDASEEIPILVQKRQAMSEGKELQTHDVRPMAGYKNAMKDWADDGHAGADVGNPVSSNWVSDTDDDNDEDGECVPPTPPEKRGLYASY